MESSTEQVNKVFIVFVELYTKFNISFKLKSTYIHIDKAVEYVNKVIGMNCVFA